MNERLAAMLAMAALRDGLVVKAALAVGIALLSVVMLQSAPFPSRTRTALIIIQDAALLFGWIALLVALALA